MSGAAVVPGGERDVQRLLERVLARLARLQADQVEDLRLPVEHQVVQPQQRRSSGVDRGPGPLVLRRASPPERLVDVALGGLRDVGQRLAVER